MNDETLRTIAVRAAKRKGKTEYFIREMLKRLAREYDLDAPPIPGSAWNNVAWLSLNVQWPRDYGVIAAQTAERRGRDATDLFDLQCRTYESLEDYLSILLRYHGTDAEEPDDDKAIKTTRQQLADKAADIIANDAARAAQYFASK